MFQVRANWYRYHPFLINIELFVPVVELKEPTNFVGANLELRECINDWNQDKIGSVLSQEGIQWVFNPPAAPHMGSVWERLVRSCKKALNVVLQNQVLTDEVFLTAFAEVE